MKKTTSKRKKTRPLYDAAEQARDLRQLASELFGFEGPLLELLGDDAWDEVIEYAARLEEIADQIEGVPVAG